MFITAVCVIFLIKLRWPKSKSLYDIDFIPFYRTCLAGSDSTDEDDEM